MKDTCLGWPSDGRFFLFTIQLQNHVAIVCSAVEVKPGFQTNDLWKKVKFFSNSKMVWHVDVEELGENCVRKFHINWLPSTMARKKKRNHGWTATIMQNSPIDEVSEPNTKRKKKNLEKANLTLS